MKIKREGKLTAFSFFFFTLSKFKTKGNDSLLLEKEA